MASYFGASIMGEGLAIDRGETEMPMAGYGKVTVSLFKPFCMIGSTAWFLGDWPYPAEFMHPTLAEQLRMGDWK